MRTGELSSNVFTRLVEPEQSIEGDWFRAKIQNNKLTEYHIKQSKGYLPKGGLSDPAPAPAPAASNEPSSPSTPPQTTPTEVKTTPDTLTRRTAPIGRPKSRRQTR